MDAKDILIEAAIDDGSEDGPSKFSQIATSLPSSNTKNYQDATTLPRAKVDLPTSRPCAVIGPDRILPQLSKGDLHLKKSSHESWVTPDNLYRNPPEYPHKITTYQSPLRNISPRQTFQENMQRIMVPPSYNSMKTDDNIGLILDRNTPLNKDSKSTGSFEPKYCDVPYSINPINENIKSAEMCVSDTNNTKNFPPGWHPGTGNVRQSRPYGAHSLYDFPGYANCSNTRAVHISRPQGMLNEDINQLYTEPYYQHANFRFRPYPNIKERYPQTRYDYINNYSHPYNPVSPFPPPKYDIQKHMPTHPTYPQVPLKYTDNRLNDPIIDGYQRQTSQICYNVPYQSQMIHPTYGSMANGLPSKFCSYTSDSSAKAIPPNKLPYNNNKYYYEYENIQNKHHSGADNLYINDMIRPHLKNQVVIPSCPAVNMHPIPPQYIRKENFASKYYDYAPITPHVRHIDQSFNTNSHITRLSSQYSPNIALSPSDSNTSNDALHAQNNSFEDCGYVSQSSNASMRSIDSNFNRIIPPDYHHRHNYQFPSMFRIPPVMSKSQLNPERDINTKDKKSIDIRQFLQMWNEGDEENTGNSKEAKQDTKKLPKQYDLKSHEQLYVLGSVNVPNEELAKYDHIQKVSKLPENIKGCNNVELLKQFEKIVESSQYSLSNSKMSSASFVQPLESSTQPITNLTPRSVSPLDVEAKISQSVIHKDVGCNFELRLCSPEMLNVEVATPIQNLLGERMIEKVTNPYQTSDGNNLPKSGFSCNNIKEIKNVDDNKTISCNLINTQCSDTMKNNYTLQDLEFNSSVCLASLPRLDNDIELNFPEVNQQFINANKDSDITKSDLLSKESKIDISIDSNEIDVHLKSFQSKEKERVFTKLSKYRKNKKCETESTTKTSAKPLRTDSVIIKNPENSKCFDDAETLLSSNIIFENESTITNGSTIANNRMESNETNINFDDTQDTLAIDFSFNKSGNNSLGSKNIDITKYIESSDSFDQNISTNDTNDRNSGRDESESTNISLELNKIDKNNLLPNPPNEQVGQYIILEGIHAKEESAKQHHNNCTETTNIDRDISTEDKSSSPTHPMSSDTTISQIVENSKNTLIIQDEQVQQGEGICENSELISPLKNNIKSETLNSSHTDKFENNINSTNIEDNIQTSTDKHSASITKISIDISQGITKNLADSSTNECVNIDCDKSIQNSVSSMLSTDTSLIENVIDNINKNSTIDKRKSASDSQTSHTIQEVLSNYSNGTCTQTNDITSNIVTVPPVNESLYLSNQKVSQTIELDFHKRCNLKKELFSPWIQKLIWCNEYITYSFKSTSNKNKSIDCDYTSGSNSNLSPKQDQNEVIGNNAQVTEKINLPETSHVSTDSSKQLSVENNNVDDSPKMPSPAENFYSNEYDTTTNKTECLIDNEKQPIVSTLPETSSVDVLEVNQDNNLVFHKTMCEKRLKRSLSDSVLCVKNLEISGNFEGQSEVVPKKRKLDGHLINIHEPRHNISANVTNDGPINRRNSTCLPFNDEHLSFCIVIDSNNYIIDQENEETEEDIFTSNKIDTVETNANIEPAYSRICTEQSPQFSDSQYIEPFVLEISDAKSFENSWVDDIGCVETVVSENLMDETTPLSPVGVDLENNETDIYNSDTDHRDKVKYIYGNQMCNHDAELLETLYRTPQMNVNKTLINKDSSEEAFDLKLSNNDYIKNVNKTYDDYCEISGCISDNESTCLEDKDKSTCSEDKDKSTCLEEVQILQQRHVLSDIVQAQDDTVNSCESSISIGTVFSYQEKTLSPSHMPFSPEVSSTTSEEKSTILLKIRNDKGSRTSQLNNSLKVSNNSCKFTENSNYAKDHNSTNPRPLITKAAQKYIPPLSESLDLKVKLPLPQQSLLRLKQLKMSKLESKYYNSSKRETSVKLKPRFEDVLKSIDEIQYKMHKEKNKKQKRPVPKLVIKKNENGSHYTSSSEKEYFNPDMTGRKWQPWVFIEKNKFIDKMAIKRKTNAIFSYRKNTFIFADKFQKYKSVSNTKFVISQPNENNSPLGQLKYTIKLKHSY